MQTRPATHAEAVYLARALNLNIETVWRTLRPQPAASYAELERAAQRYVARQQEPPVRDDVHLSSQ